jgi:outer membrane protein
LRHSHLLLRGLLLLATSLTGPALLAQDSGTTHLTLPEAESMALRKNPRVAQAQYEAKAYDEVTREFRSAYLPTLQGDFTTVGADSGSRLAAGGLNNPVVYSRAAAGLSVSQLLTDFGRTSSLVDSAALTARAREQAVQSTRAEVVLRTQAAYLAVLRTRSLLAVAQETVSSRQLIADQVSALFQNKLKSSLDLSFANVNLADARLMLSSAQNNVRSAEAQLARLLVLPPETRFSLEDPHLPEQLPADSAALIQEALAQRPDLLQSRLAVQSSQKFAQAERDLARPTVGMIGTAGYVPAADGPVSGTYGAIGLNVRVPIFNGGLFRARRLEAESRSAAAQSAVRDLELQISRDVRVAWLNSSNAREQVSLTQQLLDQARLALDLAQTRYRLGLSSIVELSQSQLQYTSAEIAHAGAQFDFDAQLSILNYQIGRVP